MCNRQAAKSGLPMFQPDIAAFSTKFTGRFGIRPPLAADLPGCFHSSTRLAARHPAPSPILRALSQWPAPWPSHLAAASRVRATFVSRSIVHHLDRVGWQAIGIILLITFLIGCIIAQQGIFNFRRFGAEDYVVNLVGILVLREIGVLIVAIMVAGRSGSSYTAELGSMKMREEIDALRTMGFDPSRSWSCRALLPWSSRCRSSLSSARWRRCLAAAWSHGSTAG